MSPIYVALLSLLFDKNALSVLLEPGLERMPFPRGGNLRLPPRRCKCPTPNVDFSILNFFGLSWLVPEGEKKAKSDYINQMNQGQPETCQMEERSAAEQERSDRELVAEILSKDRKATAEFVARYADHVYAYVRRRLIPRADLVEDLVQEVFLAAWESLDKFRGDSSLRNWLLGIARHKVEDHYRKRLRELQLEDARENVESEPASALDLEEALAKSQVGQRTRTILTTLPETYSVILQWRYWEKRSLRDIAVQTGRTEKAIERLLARARQQFKKRWYERQSSK